MPSSDPTSPADERWAKVREAFDLVNASANDCMCCDEVVVLLAAALDGGTP